MKKIVLAVLLSITSMSAVYAQKGTKGIGVDLSYGTEISNLGLGGKIQYNFTDHVRLDAGADYFFKNDYTSMWDINANVNYMFKLSPKVNIYPLAGLTYTNWKFDYEDMANDIANWSDSFNFGSYTTEGKTKHINRVGANVGVGGEYNISDNLSLTAEVKYQLIKDFNQVVFSVGAAYKFN